MKDIATDPIPNGFKETKSGWIPAEWESIQLTTIAKLESGHTPSRNHPEYWDGNIPWVSLHDAKELDRNEIHDTKHSISEKGVKNSSARLLPAGTVVFSRTATVGKASTLGRVMTTSQDFANFICGPRILNLYLVYLFRSMGRYWKRLMAGSTHNTIYMPDFRRLLVTLPPLKEQEKIVEVLSAFDEVIWKYEAATLARLKRRRGLMQRLLSGKSRLLGFTGEWREVRLSKILKHVFRPVEWKPDKIFDLISIRRRSGGLFRRGSLRGDEYKTTDLHEVHEGDFLISKRQVSHGALAMVRKDFHGCHVSKEYTILENKDPKQLHMPFFDWLSRTKRMWWLTYVASNGVVIEKLIFDPKDFLKFSIRIPPTLEEQKRIVEVLETCDREIALHRRQLEAIREQKRGLMQKLLTGEVRVKL
jgi:type I restriction enzyme S subunit